MLCWCRCRRRCWLCFEQIPLLGVCLNKVPLFERNILVNQVKRK